MKQLSLLPERPADVNVTCRSCGSSFTLSPGMKSAERARECTVCPVCWATGPALEDALSGGRAECRPSAGYRLLGCVRPDGPELEGSSREEKELARMLWRLAGSVRGGR
jgi:hypothetical protein